MNGNNGANGAIDFEVGMLTHSSDTSPTVTRLREVMNNIATGWYGGAVTRVREVYVASGKDAADELKIRLPAVLWSGTFTKRGDAGLRQHSGLICVDLDRLGDRLLGIREQIESDPHTLACFLSPTATGLKVVFRCDAAKPHIESFRAAEHFVLKQFGLDIDPACKNVERLCFISDDSEAFVADDAEPLPYPEAPQEFSTPSHVRQSLGDGTDPWDDFNQRGDVPAMLNARGWSKCGKYGWRRPGKEKGISATWNYVPNRLHVFTSSTDFAANRTFMPWHVFAILECGSDFKKAVAELRRRGYGGNTRNQAKKPEIYDPGYEENGHISGSISPTESPIEIKPFTLWKPSQFIAYQPDPNSYLLGQGYVELGLWTSLIGIGGLGKTRLALHLAICQITSRAWCDITTGGTPQTFVILSTENGLRRWKNDLQTMLRNYTQAEQELIESHLLIMAMTPDEDGDLNLGNVETRARLELTLKSVNPGCVILDPFADMMDGDENKAVDVIRTIYALHRVTMAACRTAAIIIIHHARTGASNVVQAGDNFNAGNFARGSKSLYSHVRCEIQLAPQDRDNPNRFVLSCGKANDAPKFTARCVIFDPETFSYSVDPDFDIEVWRKDVFSQQKQSSISMADVVAAIAEKLTFPGSEITQKEVYDLLADSGATVRTIQRHIQAAIQLEFLRHGNKRSTIRLGSKPLPKK